STFHEPHIAMSRAWSGSVGGAAAFAAVVATIAASATRHTRSRSIGSSSSSDGARVEQGIDDTALVAFSPGGYNPARRVPRYEGADRDATEFPPTADHDDGRFTLADDGCVDRCADADT